MTRRKPLSKLVTIFLLAAVLFSCNSEPKESAFTKAARELFFNTEFSVKYDDALAFYKANNNLVDSKLFDSANAGAEATHQFIFQKHPLLKEGLKAGSIYVTRQPGDSTGFREVMYLLTKEDALRSMQAIDQKLRKSAKLVSTTDSANHKTSIYTADKTDPIRGVMTRLQLDETNDNPSTITLILIKNGN